MPHITLHPALDNFIVAYDWPGLMADAGRRGALIDDFESGRVVVIGNHSIRPDYDLLNRFALPDDRVRKLGDRFLTVPRLHRRADRTFLLQQFAHRPLFYLRLRREVLRVSADLNRLADALFPDYRFVRREVSWRFSPTGPEEMHIDSFGRDDDRQYVRFFLNVDSEPREWAVGPRLDELTARYYETAGLADLKDRSGNAYCRAINRHVYDGPDGAGMARHRISFRQGELWLCDSRLVSHQIVRGRRLVATHLAALPEGMRDPSRRVDARVAAYHAAWSDDRQAAD